VLATAQVRLAGDVEEPTAAHRWITCTRRDVDALPAGVEVVSAKHTDRQSTFMVRRVAPIRPATGSAHRSAWKTRY
jgi:ABC-2 type transport system ATP-binding protein